MQVNYNVGEVVAVRSTKFKDRPLLGRVKNIKSKYIDIELMMGTYRGKWRD